ncbi:MAG: NADH-quinone oxidoreductase subunit C [Nitrososphaeria archaeon]|nr:NADH-quinone oxidoreductase subunit C [Nitrososphaeria archaeon]
MSFEESLLNELKSVFGENIVESKIFKRRIFLKVSPEYYYKVVEFLVKEKGLYHLETMTATELKDYIEIIAHLGLSTSVSVKTAVDKNSPKIVSLCNLIPGAEFYEREIMDLMGVEFDGHPNPKRLVLPQDWPTGVHPLRKSFETRHNQPLRNVGGE